MDKKHNTSQEVDYRRVCHPIDDYNLGDYQGLSPRQARFVARYVELGDEVKAVKEVYGDIDNPENMAKRLLNSKLVGQAIEEQVRAAVYMERISNPRVLSELFKLATFDPRAAFENGKLKNIDDLPEELAAAITKVTVKEVKGRNAAGGIEKVGEITEISFANKNAAIEKLMKHRGLLKVEDKPQSITQINVVAETINNFNTQELDALARKGVVLDDEDVAGRRAIKDFYFFTI